MIFSASFYHGSNTQASTLDDKLFGLLGGVDKSFASEANNLMGNISFELCVTFYKGLRVQNESHRDVLTVNFVLNAVTYLNYHIRYDTS